MNQDCIVRTNIMLELTDSFEKWLTFDIAYSSTYFDDGDFCVSVREISVETAFDFIRNMGNNLDCTSSDRKSVV